MIDFRTFRKIVENHKPVGKPEYYQTVPQYLIENRTFLFTLPRHCGKTNAIIDWMMAEGQSLVFVPRLQMIEPFRLFADRDRAYVSAHNLGTYFRGNQYRPVDYIFLEEYLYSSVSLYDLLHILVRNRTIDNKTSIVGFGT